MRDFRIVNLRSIAIITVVIGHSIILYSSHWSFLTTDVKYPLFDYAKDIINLYQMQLYFFISGFLMYSTLHKNQTYSKFIIGKIYRLIVPYFVFGLLWMLPIKNMIGLPSLTDATILNQIKDLAGGINNGHLWFLYALFGIFAILYPINKLLLKTLNNNVLVKIGGGILLLILALLPIMLDKVCFRHFNINEAIHYAFWFQLGITIHYYNLKTFILISLLSIGVFALTDPTLIKSLIIVLGLYYAIPSKENKTLDFIDRHSFGVYLLHSPLIYITFTYLKDAHPLIVFATNFIVMGGFALLLTLLIKRSRINNLLKI